MSYKYQLASWPLLINIEGYWFTDKSNGKQFWPPRLDAYCEVWKKKLRFNTVSELKSVFLWEKFCDIRKRTKLLRGPHALKTEKDKNHQQENRNIEINWTKYFPWIITKRKGKLILRSLMEGRTPPPSPKNHTVQWVWKKIDRLIKLKWQTNYWVKWTKQNKICHHSWNCLIYWAQTIRKSVHYKSH